MKNSEGLKNSFDSNPISPDSVKRIFPKNILPEFRQPLAELLKEECYKGDIISPEVIAAISEWNNKLLALWTDWNKKTRNFILQVANDNDLKKAA